MHGLHHVHLNPHQPHVVSSLHRSSSLPAKVVASAEEVVFVLTLLPIIVMVGLGLFKTDWALATTPPALGSVDWKSFIQIMFWTSTYWQKVKVPGGTLKNAFSAINIQTRGRVNES